MQMKYTEEKRNTFSKETLIQLFLTQQEQLSEIDGKLQLVLEQLAVMNQNRFGRKTEQMPVPEQLAFTDVDGELVLFNEAEVLAALDEREKETTVKKRPVKKKGKREEDLSGIPVVKVEHYLTEKELEYLFGKAGWKQLPDEIYKRYRFIPAKVEVEEHHVGVYASKEGDTMKKAPHPACLLRGSLVSPHLLRRPYSTENTSTQFHLPVWKKSSGDMDLPSPVRTWRTGQSNVQTGILPYFMIIFISISTRVLLSMQMRLLFW